ncbi:MAG TPA: hypothetical protein VFJ90_12735, partial [Candidatus Didemnitutus sp.]|nr:hypothetical protein [Candidatus Didemnitutus sp.]
ADKNWLVREYEKLENKDNLTSDDEKLKLASGPTEEKSEHEQLQDQLIANDPKSREASADSRQHPKSEPLRAPDPFAPFMKDWLANSPASGPMYDALVKANGSQSPAMTAPIAEPAGAVTNVSSIATDLSASDSRSARTTVPPGPNPFLAGLELPNSRESSLSILPSGPVSEVAAPASILPIKGTSSAGSDIAEPARRNSVTPPPSKLSDDKKYFPQQKRF